MQLEFSWILNDEKNRKDVFLNKAHMQGSAYQCAHLGMPFSQFGTDGQSLSIAVRNCIDKYTLSSKVVAYTKNNGGNLVKCIRELCSDTPRGTRRGVHALSSYRIRPAS